MSSDRRYQIYLYANNDIGITSDAYQPDESEMKQYFADADVPWGPGSSHFMSNWCGIWATHILRMSGLFVRWAPMPTKYCDSAWGIVSPISDVIPVYDDVAKNNIEYGDVGVIQDRSHHFIIADASGDMLECLDGNGSNWGPYGTINRRWRSRGELAWYYRIT